MEGGGRFTNSGSSAPGLKQTDLKMKQTSSSNNNGKGISNEKETLVREQDRFVPVANVIRIMRRMLLAHGKISDDSKEAMQECVSEFIMFVTLEANDKCKHEQRKTVTAEDVLWAMGNLGLDHYVEPLSLFLRRYRETEWDRTSVRGDSFFKVPSTTAVDLGATSSSGPVMTPTLPIDNSDPLWFLGESVVGDYVINADANIGRPEGQYYK